MNKIPNALLSIIHDYVVGDTICWKSNFDGVLNQITDLNADDNVSYYFNHTYFRHKDIEIDILNFQQHINDTKFKNKLIHDVLNVLKTMHHPLFLGIEHLLLNSCFDELELVLFFCGLFYS